MDGHRNEQMDRCVIKQVQEMFIVELNWGRTSSLLSILHDIFLSRSAWNPIEFMKSF